MQPKSVIFLCCHYNYSLYLETSELKYSYYFSHLNITILPIPPAKTDTMDQSVKEKLPVISGSDRLVGAKIARELSAAGANVVIYYPNSDPVLIQRGYAVLFSLPTPGIAVEAGISTTTSRLLSILSTRL